MQMDSLSCGQVWWKNVSFDEKIGQGNYLMKKAQGTSSNPNIHHVPEELFVFEGVLTDHDGFSYRIREFVNLFALDPAISRTLRLAVF